MSKSVYDDFQERSEAIGSKGVVVKAGLVGEGKSFLSQNMTYCPNCGDLVHFTVQDEVLEEELDVRMQNGKHIENKNRNNILE